MVPATATRVAFFQTLCYTIASNFVAWGQGALKNQLIGYHTVAQIEYGSFKGEHKSLRSIQIIQISKSARTIIVYKVVAEHNLLLQNTSPDTCSSAKPPPPSPLEVTTGHPMISITGQCDGLPLG